MTAEAATTPSALPATVDRQVSADVRGRLTMADRVVEKIAAQVAAGVPDVGGSAGRVLGLARPTAKAELGHLPRVSADIDNGVAELDIAMSVRWTAPVTAVAERVRGEVRDRVRALTGLVVDDVTITVTDLVGTPAATRRVR